MQTILVQTHKKREVIDITDEINKLFSKQEASGCIVSVQHTTAALTILELDPGTDLDFLDVIEKLTPHLSFRHPHDPSHAPDHIWSALIGTSLSLIIQNSELVLGTWQRIVLVELDGPRERKVAIQPL